MYPFYNNKKIYTETHAPAITITIFCLGHKR